MIWRRSGKISALFWAAKQGAKQVVFSALMVYKEQCSSWHVREIVGKCGWFQFLGNMKKLFSFHILNIFGLAVCTISIYLPLVSQTWNLVADSFFIRMLKKGAQNVVGAHCEWAKDSPAKRTVIVMSMWVQISVFVKNRKKVSTAGMR